MGIHDNFFQLGGNSLLGTPIVTRIRVAFQIDLPLRVLFEGNTVYDLVLLVEDVMLSELEALDEEETERMLSTHSDDGFLRAKHRIALPHLRAQRFH